MFKKLFKKKIDFKNLYKEYPPGIRYNLLLHLATTKTKADDFEEMMALRDAYSAIENIVVDRNLQGREFEKAGRVDHAIRMYELNVADQVDTPFPYDRLRIIYSKRKQYTEAIRVAFCANGGHIFQKVTVEAALLAADAVGSDLRSWLDKK